MPVQPPKPPQPPPLPIPEPAKPGQSTVPAIDPADPWVPLGPPVPLETVTALKPKPTSVEEAWVPFEVRQGGLVPQPHEPVVWSNLGALSLVKPRRTIGPIETGEQALATIAQSALAPLTLQAVTPQGAKLPEFPPLEALDEQQLAIAKQALLTPEDREAVDALSGPAQRTELERRLRAGWARQQAKALADQPLSLSRSAVMDLVERFGLQPGQVTAMASMRSARQRLAALDRVLRIKQGREPLTVQPGEEEAAETARSILAPTALTALDKFHELVQGTTLTREGVETFAPFAGDVAAVTRLLDVYRAAQRVKEGRATPYDRQLVADYAAEMKRGEIPKTFGYQVAEVLASLPKYAAEFAMTGPVYRAVAGRTTTAVREALAPLVTRLVREASQQAGRAGIVGAAEAAAQPSARLIVESMFRSIEDASKRIAVKTLQATLPKASALAGAVAGAAAQSAAMPTFLAAETMRKVMPSLRTIEREMADWDDDFLPALAKAAPRVYAEIFTERAGGAFEPLFAKLSMPAKVLGAKLALMTQWLAKHPGKTTLDFLNRVRSEIGWHGVLPELAEEWSADVANAIFHTAREDEPAPPLIRLVTGDPRPDPDRVSLDHFDRREAPSIRRMLQDFVAARQHAAVDFARDTAAMALAFSVFGSPFKAVELASRVRRGLRDQQAQAEATVDEAVRAGVASALAPGGFPTGQPAPQPPTGIVATPPPAAPTPPVESAAPTAPPVEGVAPPAPPVEAVGPPAPPVPPVEGVAPPAPTVPPTEGVEPPVEGAAPPTPPVEAVGPPAPPREGVAPPVQGPRDSAQTERRHAPRDGRPVLSDVERVMVRTRLQEAERIVRRYFKRGLTPDERARIEASVRMPDPRDPIEAAGSALAVLEQGPYPAPMVQTARTLVERLRSGEPVGTGLETGVPGLDGAIFTWYTRKHEPAAIIQLVREEPLDEPGTMYAVRILKSFKRDPALEGRSTAPDGTRLLRFPKEFARARPASLADLETSAPPESVTPTEPTEEAPQKGVKLAVQLAVGQFLSGPHAQITTPDEVRQWFQAAGQQAEVLAVTEDGRWGLVVAHADRRGLVLPAVGRMPVGVDLSQYFEGATDQPIVSRDQIVRPAVVRQVGQTWRVLEKGQLAPPPEPEPETVATVEPTDVTALRARLAELREQFARVAASDDFEVQLTLPDLEAEILSTEQRLRDLEARASAGAPEPPDAAPPADTTTAPEPVDEFEVPDTEMTEPIRRVEIAITDARRDLMELEHPSDWRDVLLTPAHDAFTDAMSFVEDLAALLMDETDPRYARAYYQAVTLDELAFDQLAVEAMRQYRPKDVRRPERLDPLAAWLRAIWALKVGQPWLEGMEPAPVLAAVLGPGHIGVTPASPLEAERFAGELRVLDESGIDEPDRRTTVQHAAWDVVLPPDPAIVPQHEGTVALREVLMRLLTTLPQRPDRHVQVTTVSGDLQPSRAIYRILDRIVITSDGPGLSPDQIVEQYAEPLRLGGNSLSDVVALLHDGFRIRSVWADASGQKVETTLEAASARRGAPPTVVPVSRHTPTGLQITMTLDPDRLQEEPFTRFLRVLSTTYRGAARLTINGDEARDRTQRLRERVAQFWGLEGLVRWDDADLMRRLHVEVVVRYHGVPLAVLEMPNVDALPMPPQIVMDLGADAATARALFVPGWARLTPEAAVAIGRAAYVELSAFMAERAEPLREWIYRSFIRVPHPREGLLRAAIYDAGLKLTPDETRELVTILRPLAEVMATAAAEIQEVLQRDPVLGRRMIRRVEGVGFILSDRSLGVNTPNPFSDDRVVPAYVMVNPFLSSVNRPTDPDVLAADIMHTLLQHEVAHLFTLEEGRELAQYMGRVTAAIGATRILRITRGILEAISDGDPADPARRRLSASMARGLEIYTQSRQREGRAPVDPLGHDRRPPGPRDPVFSEAPRDSGVESPGAGPVRKRVHIDQLVKLAAIRGTSIDEQVQRALAAGYDVVGYDGLILAPEPTPSGAAADGTPVVTTPPPETPPEETDAPTPTPPEPAATAPSSSETVVVNVDGPAVETDAVADAGAAKGAEPNVYVITESGPRDLTDPEPSRLAVRTLLDLGDAVASAEQQAVLAAYDQRLSRETRPDTLTLDEEIDLTRSPTQEFLDHETARALWGLIEQLGFEGGVILNPSLGVGQLFGTMPASIRSHPATTLLGFETNPVAARIAQKLYPNAYIEGRAFDALALPPNIADLALFHAGRDVSVLPVPRADQPLVPGKAHDLLLQMAVRAVRPGGLIVAVMPYRAQYGFSDLVERAVAREADLVAHVHLMGDVSDEFESVSVLILTRRAVPRDVEADPEPVYWEVTHRVGGEQTASNAKIAARQFWEALETLPADVYVPRPETTPPAAETPEVPVAAPPVGSYVVEAGTGRVGVVEPDRSVRWSGLPEDDQDRLRAFVALRDAYLAMIETQRTSDDDGALQARQVELMTRYEAFRRAYGLLHDRTNRRLFYTDPAAPALFALEQVSYVRKGRRLTPVFTRLAPIATTRVVRPVRPPTAVAGGREALRASLTWRGRIDPEYMTSLTGRSWDALMDEIGDALFQNPATGQWELAEVYLSGDVVTKLGIAKVAAAVDPAYRRNVTALEAVQPTPKLPAEIDVPFGAPWVPDQVYETFLNEEVGARRWGNRPIRVSRVQTTGVFQFVIEALRHTRHPLMPTFAKGIGTWVEHALHGAFPVFKQHGEVDREATDLYRASLDALRERWDAWWRADERVATLLARLYNAQFNRLVPYRTTGEWLDLPSASTEVSLRPWQRRATWRALATGATALFHAVGAGKTLVMVATALEQRRRGLARKPMIVAPNAIVAAHGREAMKLYPWAKVLVPQPEDLETPQARKALLQRIRQNDWDLVILPASMFVRLPVRAATRKRYVESLTRPIEEALARELDVPLSTVREGLEHPRSRRALVLLKALARVQSKYGALVPEEDLPDEVYFEDLGVDALFIDESHDYKGLPIHTNRTNVLGIRPSESARAIDMALKIAYVADRSQQRNLMVATGTPITNVMAEIYVSLGMVARPLLERLGFGHFDAFANTFAIAAEQMEAAPGGGYVDRIRLKDWRNVKTLHTLVSAYADIFTADDLRGSGQVSIPRVKHGRATVIRAKATPAQERFLEELRDRLDAVKRRKVPPNVDNLLRIITHAALGAVDLRLVWSDVKREEASRLPRVAEEVAKRYHDPAWAKDKAVQLVFLDVGTPLTVEPLPKAVLAIDMTSADEAAAVEEGIPEEGTEIETQEVDEGDVAVREAKRVDLYADLKADLIAKGIPADQIAFLHQARNDTERLQLYEAVRRGIIRVLILSRRMGALGLNVQTRVAAVHHVDVPWVPHLLEQSEGRALRQGNQFPEVEILRYVTERSFDEYRWGLLSMKREMIARFLRGELETLEDLDPMQLDMQIAQALASGDQRVLDLIGLQREAKRLEAKYRNWQQSVEHARADIARVRLELDHREEVIAFLSRIGEGVLPTWIARGRPIKLWVGLERGMPVRLAKPVTYHLDLDTDRATVRETLGAVVSHPEASRALTQWAVGDVVLASMGPLKLMAAVVRSTTEDLLRGRTTIRLAVTAPNGPVPLGHPAPVTPGGKAPDLVAALGQILRPDRLNDTLSRQRQQYAELEQRLDRLETEADRPFPFEAEREALLDRIKTLEAELRAGGPPQEIQPPTPPTPPTPATPGEVESGLETQADEPDSEPGEGGGQASMPSGLDRVIEALVSQPPRQAPAGQPGGAALPRPIVPPTAGQTTATAYPPSQLSPGLSVDQPARDEQIARLLADADRWFGPYEGDARFAPYQRAVRRIAIALGFMPVEARKTWPNTVGTFFLEGVIRMAYPKASRSTLFHELGHAVDIWITEWSEHPRTDTEIAELLALGEATSRKSYTPKQRMREGVANFMALWMYDPQAARRQAPEFARRFESWIQLSQHPVAQAIADGAHLVRHFQAMTPQEQADALTVYDPEPSLVDKTLSWAMGTYDDPRTGWQRIREAVDDDKYALKVAESLLKGQPTLDPRESVYWLTRLLAGGSGRAAGFVKFEIRADDFTYLGPGLEQVVRPILEATDGYRLYKIFVRALIARRERRAKELGYRTTYSEPMIAAALQDASQEPLVMEAIDRFFQHRDAFLTYLQHKRFLGPETRRRLEMAWLDSYAPLARLPLRLMGEDGRESLASKLRQKVRLPRFLRRYHGSFEPVIDPIVTDLEDLFQGVAIAEENFAMLALIHTFTNTDTDPRVPGGRWMQRIPPDRVKQVIPVAVIQEHLRREQGASEPAVQDFINQLKHDLTLWAPRYFAVGRQRYVTARDGDTLVVAQVLDEGLWRLITSGLTGPRELNILLRILSLPAQIVRATATLSMTWWVRNNLKDSQNLAFYHPRRMAGEALAFFRAIPIFGRNLKAFGQLWIRGPEADPRYKLFLHAMAGQSTFTAQFVDEYKRHVRHMRSREARAHLRQIVLHPWDLAKALANFAVARSHERQQAISALARVLSDIGRRAADVTLTPITLLQRGREISELTTRLQLLEDLTKEEQARLFGAQLPTLPIETDAEMARAFMRQLGSAPIRAVRRSPLPGHPEVVGPTGLSAQALRYIAAHTRNDLQDFNKMGSLVRYLNRVVPFLSSRIGGWTRFAEAWHDRPELMAERLLLYAAFVTALAIVTLDDDEYDQQDPGQRAMYHHIPVPQELRDQGWGPFIKVPKAFEFGDLATLVETGIRMMAKDRDLRQELNRMMPSVRDLMYQLVGGALLPILEIQTNYHFWGDRPIVNPWDLGLDPELHVNRWTTETAKALGRLTGFSPALIDHLLYSYGTSIYRDFSKLSDAALTGLGVTPPRPSGGALDYPLVSVFYVGRDIGRYDIDVFVRELRRLEGAAASIRRYWDQAEYAKARERADDEGLTIVVNRKGEMTATSDRLVLMREGLRTIRALQHEVSVVMGSWQMTPTEKRERLTRLTEAMINTARTSMGLPPLVRTQRRAARPVS